MKITLTPTDLRPQARPKEPKRLPGETHPFVPRSSIRNLVPPQHLEGGAVVSGRKHEVGHTDPLMQCIEELKAEVAALRRACHLIHQRHFTESGSLEMAEIDGELRQLGLLVWTWDHNGAPL